METQTFRPFTQSGAEQYYYPDSSRLLMKVRNDWQVTCKEYTLFFFTSLSVYEHRTLTSKQWITQAIVMHKYKLCYAPFHDSVPLTLPCSSSSALQALPFQLQTGKM